MILTPIVYEDYHIMQSICQIHALLLAMRFPPSLAVIIAAFCYHRQIYDDYTIKKQAFSMFFDACLVAKDTSLIQNAPGSPVPVCWVNTLAVSRLFCAVSVCRVNTLFVSVYSSG